MCRRGSAMSHKKPLLNFKLLRGRIESEQFKGSVSELLDDYHRCRLLVQVSQSIALEKPIEEILENILDKLNTLTGAERSLILLLDNSGEIVFQKGRKLPSKDIEHPNFEVSWSIINDVRRSGRTIFLPNALEDSHYDHSKSVLRLHTLSVLCTPIKRNATLLGVYYADNRSVQGVFHQSQCDLAEQVMHIISNAAFAILTRRELLQNVQTLQQQLLQRANYEELVGQSGGLQQVLRLVDQVADTTATVLLEGASGTGKEWVARALHRNSRRKDNKFVSLNCGALAENLLESELFGHVRGAFTGAYKDKKGWFELADGGTIFFDEISEMSPSLQVKLLRILQTGEYTPVGGGDIRRCDVRIIAATNINMAALVKSGKFRQDLFYRLNIINIKLPTLRERREDIPLLARHFIQKYSRQMEKEPPRLSSEAEQLLLTFDYPGNVRELENAMHRAVVLCTGETILPQNLPEEFLSQGEDGSRRPGSFAEEKARAVADFEKRYIDAALTRAKGVVARAARASAMDAKNFFQKMTKYGIDAARYKR